MAPNKTNVHALVIRGNAAIFTDSAHAYVSGTGVLTAGDRTDFPQGRFLIEVSPAVDPEAWNDSLRRIVRNSLSAYPIIEVVDGEGLSFDLKAWLQGNKAQL